MIIYLALLIPVCMIIYSVIFYKHKITIWELGIPVVVVLLMIIGVSQFSKWSKTRDIEYWGHLGTIIVHKEPYSYEDTCSRSVACGTDSKGNTKYCTEYYTCIQDVRRKCFLQYPSRTDNGSGEALEWESAYISYAKYKQLDSRWKNNNHKFKQEHRDYYHRKNHGGAHWVFWDKKWQTAEPMVTVHSWKNKVQASSSVLNYPEVSKEEIKDWELYEYPIVNGGYELPTILDHYKSTWAADLHFRFVNAELGPVKKVRTWILMFRNKDIQAARMQEAYWKGGNKNEVVICIGTDNDYNISWCHVFSWTDEKVLLTEIRNKVIDYNKISDETLLDFSKFLEKDIGQKFIKKDFDEFSYLVIEPSNTSIIITFILAILVSLASCIWAVKNQFEDKK